MTLLSRSRSVNSPTSLPRSQTSAHPKRLVFIASTVSRMLASRSTIAGWRSGRRRILTSLNLSAIDIVNSSWQSLKQDASITAASGSEQVWRLKPRSLPLAAPILKIEAAIFENIVGDRFGGDDADWVAISDDRHVTIFTYGHFVDGHPYRIPLSDCFWSLGHHFAYRKLLKVKLAPGDFVEKIALGQNADQLAVFDSHRLPDADGLDARNGVSHRIGWADQHKPIIRDVADGVFHQVHLQAPG